MIRFVLIAIGLALCGICCAQSTLKFVFPSARERQIWISDMPPEAMPGNMVAATGGTFEFKVTNPGARDQVFVWDKETGNLASKPVAQFGETWTLQDSDYKLIMQVRVRIEHKGKPVETASVRFKDGRQDRNVIMDSSAHGTLTFFAVRPGNVALETTYSSKGKTVDPIQASYQVALKRNVAIPTFVVSIAEPVATVGEASESSGKSGENSGSAGREGSGSGGSGSEKQAGNKPGSDTTNPIGGLLSFLVALAVAIAAFYFLFIWLKKNQLAVQRKLEEMGVQVPKSPDVDPATTQSAPAVVQPPPEKIILTDALHDAVSPTSSASQSMVSGVPKLLGAGGRVIEIQEGNSLVSRETGEILISGETTISRTHATVIRQGDRISIRDEGSTNGTFVNGIQISAETELRPGDAVQFGSVQFRFEA